MDASLSLSIVLISRTLTRTWNYGYGSQITDLGREGRPNPTYQAFVTLQPDWLPFNSLGAEVVNKRKYKTDRQFQTYLT